jgi:hypothetical protein
MIEKFCPPPEVQPYQIHISQLFADAWRLSKGHRFKFWILNYLVVALSFVPMLAPLVTKLFPSIFIAPLLLPPKVYFWVQALMPIVYFIYVMLPLHLSLMLVAARIVYQQPYQQVASLSHYFRLFWLVNIVGIIFIMGFVIGIPWFFIFTKALLIPLETHQALGIQQWLLLGLLSVASIVLLVYGTLWINLIFIGRVFWKEAFITARKAISGHFLKMLWLIICTGALVILGRISHHITDLLFTPFYYLVWLQLYRQIFGDKGFRPDL